MKKTKEVKGDIEGNVGGVDQLVDCSKHGDRVAGLLLALDGQLIGKYCFHCYNRLLSKKLKNYV